MNGRVFTGVGDAKNWATAQISDLTGYQLVPGTLNVKLDQDHEVRPDFTLRMECREDMRPEDLYLERCWLLIGDDRVRALIARTSTNYHGPRVLEIMAEQRLRTTYALAKESELQVEVCVPDTER